MIKGLGYSPTNITEQLVRGFVGREALFEPLNYCKQ
jgi:hypothetical protein